MPTLTKRLLAIALCFFASHAGASDDPNADLQKGLPTEVNMLIDRLAGCAHWSGEEPYDAARKREIARALKRLKCERVEQDEQKARRRYLNQPAVLRALQQAKESG